MVVFSSDQEYTLLPLGGTRLTVDPGSSRITLPVVGGTRALTWTRDGKVNSRARSRVSAERRRDVVDLLDQSLAVAGHGDEAVVLVEGRRGFVDRVDGHQPGGGNVAGLHGSAQGVHQQLAAEPLSLQRPVQRESGQEHRRDGVG